MGIRSFWRTFFLVCGFFFTTSAFPSDAVGKKEARNDKKNLEKCLEKISPDFITNPLRTDGFGGQFQTIIYSVIFAELNGKEFRYTPFANIAHNYNGDVDFNKKMERLINFLGNFKVNRDLNVQKSMNFCVDFFEANMTLCLGSESLKKIKRIFRKNKNRGDYFNSQNFNIAVHIRRSNPHDVYAFGTDMPDAMYLKIIDILREIYFSKNPMFHIYSEGDVEMFRTVFYSKDIQLHINAPLQDTFASMVLADALVTARSSLSYTAGILSEGIVYYIPFWHPPLPNWVQLEFDAQEDLRDWGWRASSGVEDVRIKNWSILPSLHEASFP